MKKRYTLLLLLVIMLTVTGCGQLRPALKEIPEHDPSYLDISLQDFEKILMPFSDKVVENEYGLEVNYYNFKHELFLIDVTEDFITKIQEERLQTIAFHINTTNPLDNKQFSPEFYRIFDPLMKSLNITYDKAEVDKLFDPAHIIKGGNLTRLEVSETVTLRTGLVGGMADDSSDGTGLDFIILPKYENE